MTELQYLWGWGVYLTGAMGCLLSLWFIVRKWHPRVKRPLMLVFAVVFFLPGSVNPELSFFSTPGPALFISLYDGLSQGAQAMWRTGQSVAIIASIAAIAGLLLPVGKGKTESRDQQKPPTSTSSHPERQRKEPTCH
ncbi:hypothetical protein [Endozoicomonas sp. ONNA2]|uniref:hypothetical protein n=1 Tax=Endozoicomonas sp. ONNA2 TaxID=2828741 RepID=UPI0021484BA0|nr:hypothetical protein [Endozoicomonas sp. ONNA2]